ncbi:right-handed parallel beta-helix repeat-containing protein [Bacillus sp. Marseille-P3800]|uniref:right-handed parallel beta-helix repeat-containing protein n=1 Tax=Bacillus sp. Marseille-P3800 TaxID=2014782 RepID=UPI000C07CC67|nr:right-handed parallel beta-helix repeat-containing protein [Bacillus sp. Marseille-P3800]
MSIKSVLRHHDPDSNTWPMTYSGGIRNDDGTINYSAQDIRLELQKVDAAYKGVLEIEKTITTTLDCIEDEINVLHGNNDKLNKNLGALEKDLNDLRNSAVNALKASKTYTVGASGDYISLNAAIEDITKNYASYKKGGVVIELKLQKGFVMREQVLVRGIDLGFILITSEDTQVTIQRSSLVTPISDYNQYPAFGALRGTLPMIGALFSMDTSGNGTDRDGVMVEGGFVTVLPGCGVKNASYKGLFANRSGVVNAHESVFTDSGNDNAYALNSSVINAFSANFSGAKDRCVRANRASTINVHSANLTNCKGEAAILATHGSTINAYNTDCSNAAGNGAHAKHNCVINMRSSQMKNVKGCGVLAESSSIIDASSSTYENITESGAYALNSSTIDLRDSTIKNAGEYAVIANRGSTISAHRAEMTGAKGESAVMAQHGSTINAWGADLSGAAKTGLKALYASNINAKNANLKNVKGKAVYSEDLSNIVASACDFSDDAVIEVQRGANVTIFATNEKLKLSQEINKLTRDGVIFQ